MVAGTDALLAALNPAQREAVEAPDGPLLIFAGAGSGKTRVLTHRIAYVIAARGVRPQEILAVTFTNKAAREMRGRVEKLLGTDISGMWLGTFHAVGARILRRDGDAIGIPQNFVIYDEADRLAAMRRAMQSMGIDDKRLAPSKIVHAVSAAKNELLDPPAYAARASGYLEGEVARIYRAYDAELSAAGALDFDDLLMRTVQLLQDIPPVLEHYRQRWSHLFVDEYQDTNHAQYLMVSLLAATHRNLTVVGDDDQCLAAGTLVSMADGSRKPIEAIRPGDRVCSAGGSGVLKPGCVTRASTRHAEELIRIRTKAGREVVSTPEHVHFAGYRLGRSPVEASRDIVVTLCAEPRGAAPRHLVAVGGDDQAGADVIRGLGLQVHPCAGAAARSWGYETVSDDMATLTETANRLRDALGGVIVMRARFGANADADRSSNSLPATRADSVHPGMAMFDERCGYDVVAEVERIAEGGPVFDIDVEHSHNFIANGLITHNSVYRFRGADIRNILEFQKDFPDARVVTLEQNYRSSQPILDTAHAVIRVNEDRAAKRLWTERGGGQPVRLIPVYDEREEALAVCGEIERLIGSGEVLPLRLRRPLPHQRPVPGLRGRPAAPRRSPTGWSAGSASTSARR